MNDVHIDPDYKEGTNGVCFTYGGCCNADSGPVVREEDRSGYWGFNSKVSRCDMPYRFFDKTLE